MKTVNKEDSITITVGDLFTACYDAAINAGIEHADAHNLSDNALANAIKRQVNPGIGCTCTSNYPDCSDLDSKVINKPKIINGKPVDRWFLVDGPNEFFQKKEYAIEYLLSNNEG
jgi:hypothetical protein